jgi:hypothetical protein
VLDFEHIRDDDAPVPGYVGWEDAREFIEATSIQAGRLRLDRQARNLPSPFVAVLCEAAGMVPQLERVAEGFSVPVLGSGGFDSLTFSQEPDSTKGAVGRMPKEFLDERRAEGPRRRDEHGHPGHPGR